jgi:putative ABC transport system permease protein
MRWFTDAGQDARYAVRSLRKSPGFTAVAVFTLALGIGATTAIYSVVDTILLQPLPFTDSGRLVRVVENVPFIDAGRPPVQRGVTYQEFLEWRSRARTLSDAVAIIGMAQRTARTSHGTTRLWGAATSSQAFTLFGARAFLGRVLGADDDAHPDVVVLTFDTWRRTFASDPHAVGTTVELRAPDGGARLVTVVGVLPVDFEFPTGVTDFYTPIALDPARPSPIVTMIGRLGPGVSLSAAIEEANLLGSAIRPPRTANAPPLNVPRFDVQGLKDRLVQPLKPALSVLLAAVVVVLLIVCANVANLLLARGTARQREIAVRVAVGASRARIVRLVMTESMVLAIAGGALGALVGAAGVTLVKQLATIEAPGIFRLVFGATLLPRANEVGVNLRVLGIAFSTATLTSVVFGILPAQHLSRTDHLEAMGSRGGGSGRGEARVRATLAVGQLVMATMLLVGAGLLIHSFTRLTAVETGFNPANVLAAQLVFPADYSIARKADTIDAILTRLRAIPNVESAGFSRAGILITEELVIGTFVPLGRTVTEMRAEPVRPRVRSVSRGYLTTMGVRLLAGREFEAGDTAGAPTVIVVNRTAARRLFGTNGPVGQIVDWYAAARPGPQGTKGPVFPAQVVGVVEDVRNTTPDRDAFPEVFVDYRQLLATQQKWGDSTPQQDTVSIGFLSFAIRTSGNPAAAIPAFGRAVHAADPNAGLESILPMDRLVASNVARQRFYAVMLSAFAGVAGLLAAIGVYGVLAYAVAQRTREIGIRMALGAQRGQVVGLVLRGGAILTASGITLGLAGSAAGARFLQDLLFGVTPLDPLTFAAVSLLFGLVATAASYLPARRATTVDPMVALRSE